ncbi:hypothetical protein JG688_00008110 [Phytophthora aleatoria]|uniref:Uncharacterized protein n=1 Tax=Phytophthora aleatoria TaxID=2496075 RepID=A0A8J5IRG9_9STRA|nr:hypothetical protein JG688_00008110 [Phytophthora aleatoria]
MGRVSPGSSTLHCWFSAVQDDASNKARHHPVDQACMGFANYLYYYWWLKKARLLEAGQAEHGLSQSEPCLKSANLPSLTRQRAYTDDRLEQVH